MGEAKPTGINIQKYGMIGFARKRFAGFYINHADYLFRLSFEILDFLAFSDKKPVDATSGIY